MVELHLGVDFFQESGNIFKWGLVFHLEGDGIQDSSSEGIFFVGFQLVDNVELGSACFLKENGVAQGNVDQNECDSDCSHF